ncbi:MAG: hypothetical protein WCD76_13340, partial [Pyrinomonadaceae bacterium]
MTNGISEARAKKWALLVMAAVALIFIVGLWTAHQQRERMQRAEEEQPVINAARNCGLNVQSALDEAEALYRQHGSVDRPLYYSLHAEAIRLN